MDININDIKNGMTIIMDGNLYTIVEFQHVKPGKGPAFVRIKRRNLRTGAVTEDTFNTNIKITKAHIEKVKAGYLYDLERMPSFDSRFANGRYLCVYE